MPAIAAGMFQWHVGPMEQASPMPGNVLLAGEAAPDRTGRIQVCGTLSCCSGPFQTLNRTRKTT